MGLIEDLLAIGRQIIQSDLVQDAVTDFGLKQLIAESATGAKTYSAVKPCKGVVSLSSRQVMIGATLVTLSGSILVTEPITPANVVLKPARLEPVDIRVIVVVNGREFPIFSTPNSIKLTSGFALIKILLK